MTFFLGSIGMTVFAIGWALYRLLVKRDLHTFKDEIRIGAFFIGVWAIVWWALFR